MCLRVGARSHQGLPLLAGMLFDREKSGDKTVSIPFGKADCTVFRKVMSAEGMV